MYAYYVQITTKGSEYGYDIGVKFQSQIFLNLNLNSSFILWWRIFIFDTMIANDV